MAPSTTPPAPARVRFALPPSRGNRFQSAGHQLLELFLEAPLAPEYKPEVHVCGDYPQLTSEVLGRGCELAWAPPFLCARAEQAGGTILGRFRRAGHSHYRAAYVCAKARPVDLAAPQGLRAVWLDATSTAGYLLPRAHLRREGVDLARAFASETFAGSFLAALEAVASGLADLTAVYATPEGANRSHDGLDDLPLGLREKLQIAGYTEEAPNDGLVVAPGVEARTAAALRVRVLAALSGPKAGYTLHQAFNAEALESPGPREYEGLLKLSAFAK